MEIDRQEIDRALARGEFLPYFQPLVHLRTGELHGFELLARWHHRRRGWISPVEFIPIAERDGWVGALTHSLLRQAFCGLRETPARVRLSINISPVQLHDGTLAEQISRLAGECGFGLERLTVEITETALANDLEQARRTVEALQARGCRLALDDFGTGYSSLTQLHSLPFEELKVDRSFVSTMTERRDSRKIVAAVLGLGQSLGLTTTAEGVETQQQAEKLRWMGCELGQGWLFGEPMPAHALREAVTRTWSGAATMASSEMRDGGGPHSLEWMPSERLAHLQAVYDSAPVGLAFVDCGQRYVYLNRRLANMNGRTMLEHLGRTVAEIIPDVYPTLKPYMERALAGESITNLEVIKPPHGGYPGGTVLLTYEPARDESGEVVGISVAQMDITEVKQAQEAQRLTEEHFRNMMELLPQIPWILDAEGRALDVSRRWLELTGTTDDDWKGFGWMKALHPDDVEPARERLKRRMETGEPIDSVYRVRSGPDAPWQWVRARGLPRRDAQGTIVGWYGSLEPIEDPTGEANGDPNETR